MATPVFITVPTELLYLANAVWVHCEGLGGKLAAERQEHDYPETATMQRRAGSTQEFVIVEPRLRADRVDLWASYGKTCAMETNVTFYVSHKAKLPADAMTRARKHGVGICVVEVDGSITNIVASRDLTFNVNLPPLNRYKGNLQTKLKRIHVTFQDDWKRGFEDACKLLEAQARQKLKREAVAGTARITSGGKTVNLTAAKVDKQTLGQLAVSFCSKVVQTKIDNQLCSGLKRINPDRVNVAHNKLNARKLKDLRQRVCGHMWTIGNLLTAMS